MIRAIAVGLVMTCLVPALGDCGNSRSASESVASRAQSVTAKYNWLQYGGESTHTGNNTSETMITPQNVGTLSQLFQASLPGNIEGAPVVLTNVSTSSGTHDIAYVTTKNGWIVALDAYFGTTLWSAQPANNSNITMSSPAIDPSLAYVYSSGLDGYMHTYAVGTGAETTTGGWPELLTSKPTVEKDGTAVTIGVVGSTAYLYMGSGGYIGDAGDYQGHVTTVNLSTGAQTVFNSLCSNQPNVHFTTAQDCTMKQSGIWAKAGVTFDPLTQMLYVATGNGLYGPSQNAWGDSLLKLNPIGTGSGNGPVDSYTPSNYQALQNGDLDLGSTNALILAHQSSKYPHLAALSGKDALMRLVNLDNMSGQGAPGNVAGEISSTALPTGGEVQNPIATWVNPADSSTWVFVASPTNGMNAFQLAIDGSGNPSLVAKWSQATSGGGAAVIDSVLFFAINSGNAGALEALNPTTGAVLWTNASIASIHWQTAMAANGVVYVGDNSSELTAFSLESPLARTGWAASASLESSTAGSAIDGNTSTRWTTGTPQAPGQWFQVNFGSQQTFNYVSLSAGNSGDSPSGYQVFVSNDGATWGSAIATGTASGSAVGIGFAQVTAQYLRIVETSTSPTQNWWSITELNVFNGPLSFGGAGGSDAGSASSSGGSSSGSSSGGSSSGGSGSSSGSSSGGGSSSGASVDGGALTALVRTSWTATASISGGGAPSNAIDGDETTRFSTGAAQAAGQWFEVNMQAAVSFAEITIDAGPSTGDYPHGYAVSVSNDGSTWTQIAAGTGTTQLITVTFPTQTAQYIQVTQTSTGATTNWWSIAEFNVYSASPPPGTPVALSRASWVPTASTSGGGAPANAIDGNASTRWSTGVAQTAGQWFEVNFGSSQTFDEVTIDAGPSTGDYPHGYTVSVSNNGSSWTQVAAGSGTTQLVTVTFPPQTAQYIQVTQTPSGATTNWWSIAELNVYGAAP
jgi:hypothetical protein